MLAESGRSSGVPPLPSKRVENLQLGVACRPVDTVTHRLPLLPAVTVAQACACKKRERDLEKAGAHEGGSI